MDPLLQNIAGQLDSNTIAQMSSTLGVEDQATQHGALTFRGRFHKVVATDAVGVGTITRAVTGGGRADDGSGHHPQQGAQGKHHPGQ